MAAAIQHGGQPVMANLPITPLPMDQATWDTIAETLELSPQQKRIVELILQGQQDKEIAATMELTIPTVSTYLKRIFARTGVSSRMQLVLRIFAMAQDRI